MLSGLSKGLNWPQITANVAVIFGALQHFCIKFRLGQSYIISFVSIFSVVWYLEVYVNSISSQYMVSLRSWAFTLVTLPSMLNWQTNLVWMINCAMWSTFTRMLFCSPEDTNISGDPSRVAFTLGQNAGPERILGPIRLTPVTRMSFRQFSAVSWVHLWPAENYIGKIGHLIQHTIHTPVTGEEGGDAGGAGREGVAVIEREVRDSQTLVWYHCSQRQSWCEERFTTWNLWQ